MLPTELDVMIMPCRHITLIVCARHEAEVRTNSRVFCPVCCRLYLLHLGGSRVG